MVREGKGLDTVHLSHRLSTGALVRQLCLEDGRLQYQKLSGIGPDAGWVSVTIKGKALVVETSMVDIPEVEGGANEIYQYIISAIEMVKTQKMPKHIKINRINFFATQK